MYIYTLLPIALHPIARPYIYTHKIVLDRYLSTLIRVVVVVVYARIHIYIRE